MKIGSSSIVLALAAYVIPSMAYSGNNNNMIRGQPEVSRRNLLAKAGATAMLLGGFGSNARVALAEDVAVAAGEETLTPLYFGVGVSAGACSEERPDLAQ